MVIETTDVWTARMRVRRIVKVRKGVRVRILNVREKVGVRRRIMRVWRNSVWEIVLNVIGIKMGLKTNGMIVLSYMLTMKVRQHTLGVCQMMMKRKT